MCYRICLVLGIWHVVLMCKLGVVEYYYKLLYSDCCFRMPCAPLEVVIYPLFALLREDYFCDNKGVVYIVRYVVLFIT